MPSAVIRHAATDATVLRKTNGAAPVRDKSKARLHGWCGTLKILPCGRDVGEYEAEIGIRAGALRGKRVLDIGSGFGVFGHECRAKGIYVVDVDPSYSSFHTLYTNYGAWVRREYAEATRDTSAKVAAVHETLPIKSESVDIVVSCYSSLYYASVNHGHTGAAPGAVRTMLAETLRVLRRGGEAYLMLPPCAPETNGVPDLMLGDIADSCSGASWSLLPARSGNGVLKLSKRR